jgi:glycosyltransferase involved in cell wall biosynthesis
MHILYIHQYFATPSGSTGTRSYEFAKRWVQAGHRVTVLTTPAQLTARDLSANGRSEFIRRGSIDGIDVLVVNVAYRQTMRIGRRVLSFLGFMAAACWLAVCLPGIDVVFATSTPLTVGVPAVLARWIRGRPFVFEVRDLWPAIPIEMGILRSKALIRAARALESLIYRQAQAIVTLSPGAENVIRGAIPKDKKVVTIPNAADTDLFRPDVDGTAARQRLGWQGHFVCIHAGAMGPVNGLDLVIRAAQRLREDRNFLFVFVGEGSEKDRLRTMAGGLGLRNVQFLGRLPKHDLPMILAAADLCLMTISPVPILEHNCANKLFDYLSAGRPVLLNYGGWQRDLLEKAQAGTGCRLGDEDEFVDKLVQLRANAARFWEMPRNARRLAAVRFNRDDLAAQALTVIQTACRPNPHPPWPSRSAPSLESRRS